MKLFLTSSGITNKSLATALKRLVKGKIKIAFIPTAANIELGDKEWLIKDYVNLKKLGSIDIVDISAMPKSIWLPRLKKANVIVFGGGVTTYLVKWIKKSGLKNELPELLKKRIYVGISAGSIALAKKISVASEFLYGENFDGTIRGLGYVNFHFRPHFNSPDFPKVRDKFLINIIDKLDGDLYALDDESGLLWDNGKVKIISEGRWKLYPKKTRK